MIERGVLFKMKFMVIKYGENSKYMDVKPEPKPFDDFSWDLDDKEEEFHQTTITMPIMPALSVVYIEIFGKYFTKYDMLDDTRIHLTAYCPGEFHFGYGDTNVVVHYNGIRDYSMLFPWIADESLRKRIGEFY